MKIVDGIVSNAEHVRIGENGIVKTVINVSIDLIQYINYLESILGTYGTTLPCETCGQDG